ncbi:hypothetical protein J6T21_00725, partial [Candidatus Saccharibacteria bacterium]|nr:hypothetical protein [Candidatus Saccharibacteria bacterium]
ALIFMLNNTSPTSIGPFGVLLFFTTIYIVCFGFFTFIYQLFKFLAYKQTFFSSKDYLYAAVFAFGPIMMLMAFSFGAVSLWTVSLIIVFLTLAEFLVYKRI